MSDEARNTEVNPDQLFSERLREHSSLVQAAESDLRRTEEAVKKEGGLSQAAEE